MTTVREEIVDGEQYGDCEIKSVQLLKDQTQDTDLPFSNPFASAAESDA